MNFLRRTSLGMLFGRETYALPVDILRIAIGLLSFFYFLSVGREAGDITGPDGLLDHVLLQDVFWFTRIGLFHPFLTLELFQVIFSLALVASIMVVLGWRTKVFAAFLFLTAMSAFRWNLVVAYVEDSIMHLMLFWLLLLPVGKTLTLPGVWRDRREAWSKWKAARVPGTVIGCFLCNLALIYLVAGVWKWTSPMWRDGTALYVVLKLPISHAPEFWGPQHLPLLKIFNWSALLLEPLFPVAMLLRRGHPLKWPLLVGVVGFHLGIVATTRIPFANLACLGASVVIFRDEFMAWLTRDPHPEKRLAPANAGWVGRFAMVFIVVLTLAMVRNAPAGAKVKPQEYDSMNMAIDPRGSGGMGTFHSFLYGALWLVGIAQEYQLFNWIDVRNYHASYEIVEVDGGVAKRIDPVTLFPDTNRSMLLQCYLHDLCWIRIPPNRNAEVKRSLALRFAQRYCRIYKPHGTVVITSTVERITADKVRLVESGPEVLFSFTMRDGKVALLQLPPSESVPRAPNARGIAQAR